MWPVCGPDATAHIPMARRSRRKDARPQPTLLLLLLLATVGALDVFDNGASPDAVPALRLDSAAGWQAHLHAAFTNATRIGLWTSDGVEVAYSSRCGDFAGSRCVSWAAAGECQANPAFMSTSCQRSCNSCRRDDGSSSGDEWFAALSTGKRLHAVVDGFPFVWPTLYVGARTAVRMPDGGELSLTTLSVAPRVFSLEDVADAEERAAIMRIAAPAVRASVTFEKGKMVRNAQARTSDTGWLQLPPEGAQGDEAMLRAVWLRLAAAVRMSPSITENMQALSYGLTQHYHYHTDTGGSPSIAGRAITALLYLNDDFTGGETSFALAGSDTPMFNVHKVRQDFDDCQTERGLAVKPKAGSAVIFYNLQPNSNEKDYFTWHCSADVTGPLPDSRKMAANLWFHLGKAEQLRIDKKIESPHIYPGSVGWSDCSAPR